MRAASGIWVWGLALSCWFLACNRAPAQKPPPAVLQHIFDDWQARQKRVRSVRYVVRGKHVKAAGSVVDDSTGRPVVPAAPARDIVCAYNFTLLLDFPTGRFRLEADRELYQPRKRARYWDVSIHTFDGKVLQSALPRAANSSPVFTPDPRSPDITVSSGNLNFTVFDPEFDALFLGHGIVPLLHHGVGCGPKMRVQPDTEMFSLHGRVRYKGRDCTVLRSQPVRLGNVSYDEIWVDPERDSAVVRLLGFVGKRAWLDSEITYKPTRYGWLPAGWTFTERDMSNGRTRSIDRFEVTEMAPEPPFDDATFKVDIEPGMIISKAVMGGRPDSALRAPVSEHSYYQVGEDGTWHLLRTEVAPPRSGLPRYIWLGACVMGALAMLWGYVRLRRRLCRSNKL